MIEDKKVYIIIFKILFYFFLIVYFIYHIFVGEYGVLSYNNTSITTIKQKNILKKNINDIENRKNKINRLKENNLDTDLLEEEIRKNIGVIDKNEIVIFTEDLKKM